MTLFSLRPCRPHALLLFAAALALTAGCGRAINRSAERRIRDLLPEVLGPARQYQVHVESAPAHTVEGRLAVVTIDGDDVSLSNGLLLDRLHLDLKGVDVDTKHSRLRQIQEARFTATIGEASLDAFLAGEAPEGDPIRNVRVTLGDGNRVTVAAERVVLGAGVPFRATGPLRLLGPQRIEFDPARLVVIGISLTGTPLRFLKRKFESSIDLSTLPFPVHLTEVTTTHGRLNLSGTADVAAFLQRAQEGQR